MSIPIGLTYYSYICEKCHAFHYKYPYVHKYKKVTNCENCGALQVDCFMCSCSKKFVETLKGLRNDMDEKGNTPWPLPPEICEELRHEPRGNITDIMSRIYIDKFIHDLYFSVSDVYPGEDIIKELVIEPLNGMTNNQCRRVLRYVSQALSVQDWSVLIS